MALSIALVCAVFASLAVGVLIAYAICVAMFHLFRMHTRQVQARKATVPVATAQVRALSN